MTLSEHVKKIIYVFRLGFLTIGWLWFSIGATFIAAASVYPNEATWLVYHGLTDMFFGLLHLLIAKDLNLEL